MFSLSISQPKWDSAKNKVLYQLLQLQLQYGLQRNGVRWKSGHVGSLHETAREVIAFFSLWLKEAAPGQGSHSESCLAMVNGQRREKKVLVRAVP